MSSVQVTVPVALLEAAGVHSKDASRDSVRLLALELYRERKVSLGRAAELCAMPVEQFMVFAGERDASMHYGISDLEEDRISLERTLT